MRTAIIIFVLATSIFSCTPELFQSDGTPYANFRGFEPIDPTEYTDNVQVRNANGQVVTKPTLELTKPEMLSFMANETVLVSVAAYSVDGGLTYGPASVSAKDSKYVVNMDYMKFATKREKNDSGILLGYARIGVGLRIIAHIDCWEAGINLGDLFSIGLAAKAGKLTGSLVMEVIGIRSDEVTNVIPLPSEINQSTIQSAMQAMATIKSKIYDDKTELFPQVMAVKSVSEEITTENLKSIVSNDP